MRQHGWGDCPGESRAQVVSLVEGLRNLLADGLIGVYLHGSLAMGCFHPTRSDVDLLVLTRHRTAAGLSRDLAGLLLRSSGAPRPIEISVLNHDDLHPWRHPAPFDFHFGEDWREKMETDLGSGEWVQWGAVPQTDPDLAAHITVTLARGLSLHGPPPALAFPAVPSEDYLDSIVKDFEWALDRLAGNPTYFVLNACRVIAFVEARCVLSKVEGGEWGLSNLPSEWRGLIGGALAAYRGQAEPVGMERAELARFAAAMRARIPK